MAESSPAVSAQPAANAMPRSLVALVAVAAIAVGTIIGTVALVPGPSPDAALHPSGIEPDEELIALLGAEATELEVGIPAGFSLHTAIGGAPPASRLNNLPGHHT